MIYRNGRKEESEDLDQEFEDSGEETTLIPKSLLPKGAKVGDEVKLKIVHGFDGEFEVAYSSKEDNEPEDKSEDEKPAPEEEGMEEMVADA